MKCPLKHTLVEATTERRTWRDDDCLEEECAWWDKGFGQCGYCSQTESLKAAVCSLQDIAKKISHERLV